MTTQLITIDYLGDILTSKIHGFRFSSNIMSNPSNSLQLYLNKITDRIS